MRSMRRVGIAGVRAQGRSGSLRILAHTGSAWARTASRNLSGSPLGVSTSTRTPSSLASSYGADIEQRRFRGGVDKNVQIAVVRVDATNHRTEDPRIASPVGFDDNANGSAVGLKKFAGAHARSMRRVGSLLDCTSAREGQTRGQNLRRRCYVYFGAQIRLSAGIPS